MSEDKLSICLSNWGLPSALGYQYLVKKDTETLLALQYILQCKVNQDVVVIPYHNPFTSSPMTFTRTLGDTVEEFDYIRVRLMDAVKPTDTKYLSPKGSPVCLYFSTLITDQQWQDYAVNKTTPIVFVEGEKKADYLARFFPLILPIGISGVWQWAASKQDQYELNLKAQLKYRKVSLNNKQVTKEQLEAWHVLASFKSLLHKDKDRYPTDLLDNLSKSYIDYFEDAKGSVYGIDKLIDVLHEDIASKVHRLDQKKIVGFLDESFGSLKLVNRQKCLHKQLLDNFKINNRDVLICFDSDLDRLAPRVNDLYAHNSLMQAATELAQASAREGAKPIILPIPKPSIGQQRYGIDDFAKHYSDDAVVELINLSLSFKVELGLILNPDRPKSLDSHLTQEYKVINSKPFSKLLSANIAGVILKYYSKIAYRHNKGWYKFNKTYWEFIKGGDTEIQAAIAKCLQGQPELDQTIKASDIAPYSAVEESLWNQGEASGCVLLNNGVINLVTQEFTSIEDYPKIKENFYTNKLNINFKQPTKQSLDNLRQFISHYTTDPTELRYLLAMAYWLLFPKQYFIKQGKKFPVEKMFYLVGSQGTGKSTFLEFLTKTIAGNNVAEISPDNLDSVTGIGNYMDATLWKSNDFSGNVSKEAIETFNKVISGEPLEGRRLYKQSDMKVIPASIILAGNDTLTFPQKGTQGILRRLVYIPFNTPVKSYSRSVIDYISSQEAADTFFWLITQFSLQDCIECLNSGQYLPQSYAQFTSLTQESNDTVTDFFLTRIAAEAVEENFVSDSKAVVGLVNKPLYKADIFNQYMLYCKDNGIVNHFNAFKLEKLLRDKGLIRFKGYYSNGRPLKSIRGCMYEVNPDALTEYSLESLRLVNEESTSSQLGINKVLKDFF